ASRSDRRRCQVPCSWVSPYPLSARRSETGTAKNDTPRGTPPYRSGTIACDPRFGPPSPLRATCPRRRQGKQTEPTIGPSATFLQKGGRQVRIVAQNGTKCHTLGRPSSPISLV